jgi:DNA-binding IscR family transcriptional regulator
LDISQCPIRKAYADAQTNMEEEFRHTTLEDLSDRMPD